jgi:glycogen operon protein
VAIRTTRERVRRAMLATLMLAQGTPMLNAGDELGNTQGGNNNAYCQDNPTGWLKWAEADASLTHFVGELAALRRSEPLLHHGRWFSLPPGGPGDATLTWLTPVGTEMHVHDWHEAGCLAFACRIRAQRPRPTRDPALFQPGRGAAALHAAARPVDAAARQLGQPAAHPCQRRQRPPDRPCTQPARAAKSMSPTLLPVAAPVGPLQRTGKAGSTQGP